MASNNGHMDFSQFDSKTAAEQGTVLELLNPKTNETWVDEEGKAFTITIIGMDSAKLRSISQGIVGKRITNIRKGKGADYDAELEEAEKYRLYAQATIAWYIPPVDGETLECNERNARRLYSDPRFPWVSEQIDKAIADRQRFFKHASQS